jgi:hypothetical protein
MISKIIYLPKINDSRGNLTFFEELNQLPYSFSSIDFVYNVQPSKKYRLAANAKYLIISLSGSVHISIKSNKNLYIELNQPYKALIIESKEKIKMNNFSNNSFCLILTLVP